jgi:molybdate/tungstate transport system permease protein
VLPLALFGGHFAAHSIMPFVTGFDPLEMFNILLLCANAIIAVLLMRSKGDLTLGGAVMFLVGTHAFIGHRLAPDSLTSGAILMVNVLVLYVGVKVNSHLSRAHWWVFVASYFVLYGIFIVTLDNSEALFLLFLMMMAACARDLRLMAYFWVFTVSFTFLQPFAWESVAGGFFLLTAVFGASGKGDSALARIFLALGLFLVVLVLFPLIIMVMSEQLANIEPVLRDPDIRAAIGVTLLTATISTVILIIFVVPLSYAISRLEFPGRSLLLSLIDLPVVIPQSVAGIALIVTLGRNQFIGAGIERIIGMPVDNTILGVIAAQVFVSLPFIAKSAIAAFDSVPTEYEDVALTLRSGRFGAFRRVALPLASRGVMLGAILAWARAAGEFGAVFVLAQHPATAPVIAYQRFVGVGSAEALPIAIVLVLMSMVLFFILQASVRLLPKLSGE